MDRSGEYQFKTDVFRSKIELGMNRENFKRNRRMMSNQIIFEWKLKFIGFDRFWSLDWDERRSSERCDWRSHQAETEQRTEWRTEQRTEQRTERRKDMKTDVEI
eukprot:TRINITY_DN357_c0_g1_i16.p2 TRINITY_DN357_c0_g1~~TRINITY_DN357_c0_g1_i16.p2  ORF type:complete len:104 (-),score=11.61 TRINITY_DN357_c0_g1_i16:14-325(-)